MQHPSGPRTLRLCRSHVLAVDVQWKRSWFSIRCFSKCKTLVGSCVSLTESVYLKFRFEVPGKVQLLYFLLIRILQRNRPEGDFISVNKELACALMEAEKSPNVLSVSWRSGKPVV